MESRDHASDLHKRRRDQNMAHDMVTEATQAIARIIKT